MPEGVRRVEVEGVERQGGEKEQVEDWRQGFQQTGGDGTSPPESGYRHSYTLN